MIDTSDAAIEADLSRAESGGTPGMIAMLIGRAQIRATLRAAQPAPAAVQAVQPPPMDGSLDITIAQGPFGDSYAVPARASFEDRVTAAARMLQLEEEALSSLLFAAFGPGGVASEPEDVPSEPENVPAAPELVPPADPDVEPVDEATVDEDFFADVKKARKR